MAKKTMVCLVSCFLVVLFAFTCPVFAQNAPDKEKAKVTSALWQEFMHYAIIANIEMAGKSGQALLELDPDPIQILNLAEETSTNHYRNLTLMRENQDLSEIATKLLKVVEAGRLKQCTDPVRIQAEIDRLTSSPTTRAVMMSFDRLKKSSEWAVPQLVETLRDPLKAGSLFYIQEALVKIGQPGINPMLVALEQCQDDNIRKMLARIIGKVGYPKALPYLQQIVESPTEAVELKDAATKAIAAINGNSRLTVTAAELFEKYANDYYNNNKTLAVPVVQEIANLWFWNEKEGLITEEVPRDVFDELMAMRLCESVIKLNHSSSGAIALWLSCFYRLEADGFDQPAYFGESHADAATYALTAGPEYLHRVLSRALVNRNRPVALGAIKAMQENAGQNSLLYSLKGRKPLIDSLLYADREVRFSAALAIGGLLPRVEFENQEMVVPILAEMLGQKGQRFAIIIDGVAESRNTALSMLRNSDMYARVVAGNSYGQVLDKSRQTPGYDLIVLGTHMASGTLEDTLKHMQKNFRMAFCPTLLVVGAENEKDMKTLVADYPFVEVVLNGMPIDDMFDVADEIYSANSAGQFDATLANSYAASAAALLKALAIDDNKVLKVNDAEDALLAAIDDSSREGIQSDTIETVARINTARSQRQLATMALDIGIDMNLRLFIFDNLAISTKLYGNILLTEQIDAIYAMVKNKQLAPELRRRAAEAYGSLNLSSAKVSDLILTHIQ